MTNDVIGEQAWSSAASEAFVPVHVSSGRGTTRGSLDVHHLSAGVVTRIDVNAVRVERTPSLIGASSDDELLFGIQKYGRSTIEQRGRVAVIPAGSAGFYSSDAPYVLSNSDQSGGFVIQLNRERLGLSRDRVARLTAKTVSADDGSLSILSSLAGALLDSPATRFISADSLGPALEAMVAELSWKLASLSAAPTRRENLLQALQAYVARNLTDTRLDAARMAREHGVSERAIYSAFDALGTTPADFVRTARVRLACARLRATTMPVVDVAVAVGFNDSTTFSRAFRRGTGTSPAAYRMQYRRAA